MRQSDPSALFPAAATAPPTPGAARRARRATIVCKTGREPFEPTLRDREPPGAGA